MPDLEKFACQTPWQEFGVATEFDVVNYLPNVVTHHVYSGIDWMYSFTEQILMYDFRVWIFWLFSTYFDQSFNFFFKFYWFYTFELSSYQLYWAALLDKYLSTLIYQHPYVNQWVKDIFYSQETTLLLINHPEILIATDSIVQSYVFPFSGYLNFVFDNLVQSESAITAIMLVPQLIWIVWVLALGVVLYFSFFTSNSKEENTIDHDYMNASITVEAEEEIASFDDILLTITPLFYIFGWYFYTHCWVVVMQIPELILPLWLFPFLYYIIFFIPVFLVFDFGIYFLAYLRGVGSSPLILLELVYDYIALMAFMIRILVQGVRLLLMTFTYASLHDYIIYYSVDQRWFVGSESIWDDLNNLNPTSGTFTFFAVFHIGAKIYYWLYELIHTFFVVTAQFTAFFAMVFWLFFFLYTFFVWEKHEAYFYEKRKAREKYYEELNKVRRK
jgi:hypothetical protein